MRRAIIWICWLVIISMMMIMVGGLIPNLNTLGRGNTSRATPEYLNTIDPNWCSRITDFDSNFREAIGNRYGTSPSNIWFIDSGLVSGHCIVTVGGANPLGTACSAWGAYRLANGTVTASGSSDSCFP